MDGETKWQSPAWLVLAVLWLHFFISQGLLGSEANTYTGVGGIAVGLLVLTRHRLPSWVAAGLAVAGVVGVIVALVGDSDRAAGILRVAAMAGLLLTAILLVRELTNATRISVELLVVATCIYFLMGLFFGTFYEFIYSFSPESFTDSANEGAMVYFSFVVLTTLGFGDITAVGSLVRGLVVFETVAGQLYLAVVLASLVGLVLADASVGRPDSSEQGPDR